MNTKPAQLIPFSPLEDTSLPPNLDGLIIGGGYPEEHARELSLNVSLKNQCLNSDKPISQFMLSAVD